MNKKEIFYKHLGLPAANPAALHIEKAEGIYLYNNKGDKIIDLCAGVSVANIGHNHPKVVNAVKKQLDKYMHIHVYGELLQSPQVGFAKKISDLLPENLNSVYFVNTGSEANEGAIKLSKRYTGRYEVISFKNAYHGSTCGALSVLGNEKFKKSYRPLMPGIKFLEFNNESMLKEITEKTACVIVEPVQAEAGVILPKNNFLNKLKQKCDKTGTILIFDEVQTGFGRTGELFALNKFDVVPDILTIAKAMGGGMPIGAFVTSKEIMNALQSNPELGHITTFGGHPVSAAAGLAALNVLLNENILPQVENKGKIFLEHLKNKKIKSINGIGLLYAVELENKNQVNKFIKNAAKNGIITDAFLFAPHKFRIGPALNITNEQIEEISKKINKILNM